MWDDHDRDFPDDDPRESVVDTYDCRVCGGFFSRNGITCDECGSGIAGSPNFACEKGFLLVLNRITFLCHDLRFAVAAYLPRLA